MTGRPRLSGSLRSLIVYVVLVGLPLVGVAGALYFGEGLEAPASAKGRWRLVAPAACLAGLGETLSIAQSGPDLQLTFSGAAQMPVAGRVDGLRVTADAPAGALALEASLDQAHDASRLQGALTVPACNGPVDWAATRLPEAE